MSGEKKGWAHRLRLGLGRSRDALTDGVNRLFRSGQVDQATLDELEELLIAADLGVETAGRLARQLGEKRLAHDITPAEVYETLASEITNILEPVAQPLEITGGARPHVVLVAGVNGSGKTTTIGKLASQYAASGAKVMMAAGDTFRAAAIEQLQIWGERANCPVIASEPGA
ncbi:MAG: signal recognition particle receptor subunit alpha, partial [Rhodospirillales bacterium]|nr:signal recognition particle receptor subunit alpha [Rhodospirillales bacterium]